jgi:NADP-dependent 3-hydroxy acid dehydrogenase YdfG
MSENERAAEGRVVVVTGASSGIGLALSQEIIQLGWTVVMLARDSTRLRDASLPLGDRAVPICADVSDPEQVRDAFREIDTKVDTVDALVNLAGSIRYRLLEESTDDDIKAILETNLFGPIYMMREAIPRMKSGADIVNIGSEATLQYLPYTSLYSTSKVALGFLTGLLAKELRERAIKCSYVVVGRTATNMASTVPVEDRERSQAAIEKSGYYDFAGGSPMEARWVADAIVYVLTRPVAQHIDVLHVRGFGPNNTISITDPYGGGV